MYEFLLRSPTHTWPLSSGHGRIVLPLLVTAVALNTRPVFAPPVLLPPPEGCRGVLLITGGGLTGGAASACTDPRPTQNNGAMRRERRIDCCMAISTQPRDAVERDSIARL